MSPHDREILSDEDEVAYAPESGQPFGGRDNPWDDDEDEAGAATHAFPSGHYGPPGDDL